MICKVCGHYYNKNEDVKSKKLNLWECILHVISLRKTETTTRKQAKKNIMLLNRICIPCFERIHNKIYNIVIGEITE